MSIKFKGRQEKPPVGMEMTLTLSLPAEAGSEERRDSLLAFFGGIDALAGATKAVWIRLNCRGVPEELEEALMTALDNWNANLDEAKPKLRLVVDNG